MRSVITTRDYVRMNTAKETLYNGLATMHNAHETEVM